MKRISLLLIFVLMASFAFPNAAMPGFWSVGAGQTFIPAFAGDSIFLGSIRMKKEDIHILLYPGFGVVKGEYWMENLTDSTILLNTGFPINSGVDHPVLYAVQFTDLYELKVQVDGNEMAVRRLSRYDQDLPEMVRRDFGVENWYVWETKFEPGKLTKLTVYYLVNTNDADLREGYNVDHGPAFSYILETGKAWGSTIGEGRIRMKLMEGLEEDEIEGILPEGKLNSNGTGFFEWKFTNLEPEPTDNVVVRYGEFQENFNLDPIQQDFAKYYQLLDQMDESWASGDEFKPFTRADFEVTDTFGRSLLAIAVVIVGTPLLIIGLVIWLLVRRSRKKKQSPS
ncbi:MAG: hypothetical protein H6581_13035 [Bacteroidia bacterium]|nr:hypothetical protein [Bacteroidia bacterium]